MPKVVIKEYDQTEAGLITTNNFTVLIPGFVNPAVWTPEGSDSGNCNKKEDGSEIFDANDLYECTSQSDFEEYIGKSSPLADHEVARTFAKVTNPYPAEYSQNVTYNQGDLTAVTENETTTYYICKAITSGVWDAEKWEALVPNNVITPVDFFATYPDQLYTRVKLQSTPSKTLGHLISRELDPTQTTADVDVYNYYQYTLANDSADINTGAATYDENTKYYIIKPGDEGTDYKAATKAAHYGNQMAYYLLGLGYTVLYLRLDTIEEITDTTKWAPVYDRSMYDFRYIVSGLMSDIEDTTNNVSIKVSAVNSILNNIAYNLNTHDVVDSDSYLREGRGDCLVLQDIAKNIYMEDNTELNITKPKTQAAFVQTIKTNKDALPGSSEYCAIVAPTVFYSGMNDKDYDENNELPASFHYLACAAQAFSRYPEWFAVSGYTRGVSNLNVIGTSITLGEAAVNALQSRDSTTPGVNLVIKLRNGYYFWGNRTGRAQNGLIATSFLNIRQLCCTLKKTIYNVCRRLMFDPNSEILWLNFCNAIRPTLERMMGSQGIKGYRFEKRETSMKGKLFAVIRIIPIEAVEDFEVGVFLEDNFDVENIHVVEHLLG